MAQILRVYKTNLPMLVRSYGSQRRQHNYYEVLRISPNATQKEIKQAFITLSKEMHPDVTGKNCHEDFVKVNEAYSVLSKEDTRRQYDARSKDISHQSAPFHNEYYYYYRPAGMYNASYSNQQRGTANGYPGQQSFAKEVILILALMTFGALIQIFLLQKSLVFKRHRLLERSREIGREYAKVREEAKKRTTQEQLERISALAEEYGWGDYYKKKP